MSPSEIIAALLSPAVMLGIFKWFMGNYEKRGQELDKEKQRAIQSQISRIDSLYQNFNSDFKHLKDVFTRIDKDFAVLAEKFKFSTDETDKLMKAFQGFVASSTQRFNLIETEVKEIGKEIYRITQKKRS